SRAGVPSGGRRKRSIAADPGRFSRASVWEVPRPRCGRARFSSRRGIAGRSLLSRETNPNNTGRSSRGHSALLEQGKQAAAAFRRGFFIVDANPKKIFELATE